MQGGIPVPAVDLKVMDTRPRMSLAQMFPASGANHVHPVSAAVIAATATEEKAQHSEG